MQGGIHVPNIKKQEGFKDQRYIALPSTNLPLYLNHPLVQHTYITELGFYPSAKYHFRERFEGSNETILIYCLDGEGTIEFPNQQITHLARGNFICIPKQTFHRYYAKEENPWSIIWIHFNTPQAIHFPIDELKLMDFSSPEKNYLLQSHLIDLFQIAEKDYSIGNMICLSQLLLLILTEAYLLEDGTSYDKKNQYLTRCIHYMNEHLDEEISLEAFADYLKISPSYLNHIFQQYTEKSPIQFFIQLKMEQAAKYLELTDLKIYEIARKVSYSDPYYFSRIFKRTMGISPKNYRQQHYLKNVFIEK